MIKLPYASIVGSLMYAIVCTRPDIGYAIGLVTRFMSNPGRRHWVVVKWILWYLRGTSSVCLRFGSSNSLLEVFIDSNMSPDVDTSWSTFGYVMTYERGVVSWSLRLQKAMLLSTTKAEYMATTEAGKEIIGELGIRQAEFRLYCDN